MNRICIHQLRSRRVKRYWLLLLIGLPFIAKGNGTHHHSLSVSELNLLSDSTEAAYWSDYGWALWELGDPKADWAFKKAIHIDPGCQESIRGLGSMASVSEGYDIALGYLDNEGLYDTLSLVMKTAVLQHTGYLLESEELLDEIGNPVSSSYSGLFTLLRLRQSRLTCSPDSVVQDFFVSLDEYEPSGLRNLVKLELILLGNTEELLSSRDLLEAMSFDRLYFGGVYQDVNLSSICSDWSPELVLQSRLARLAGDPESAFECGSSTFSEEDKVWIVELLLQLDRLDSAMELVDEVLQADSSAVDAWRLKGLLLLRSYQYYEAFETMQIAMRKTEEAYECCIVAGLAAELAGETKLAIEYYAPVLAASSDSIVLINRERELVWDEDLNYNFDYVERYNFQTTDRSWLDGSFSVRYSGSTGEVEQNQLGVSASAMHVYGLFGSYISTNIDYSLQKWPGSSGMQEIGSVSVRARHRNSGHYYGSIEAVWEQRRYDVNRWKLEMSSCAGRWFQPFTPFVFEIDAGIGRVINKWNIEGNYTANWIALTGLAATLKGQMLTNYLPRISVSVDYQQQLDNLSRYDIYGKVNIDYYPARFLSIGVGYSTEYLSAIPPDYSDIHNSSVFMQFGLSF